MCRDDAQILPYPETEYTTRVTRSQKPDWMKFANDLSLYLYTKQMFMNNVKSLLFLRHVAVLLVNVGQ